MTIKTKTHFTVDELGFMQLAPTEVLAAVARNELDLNSIARHELASRGLDREGRWVGFEKAQRLAGQMPMRGARGQMVYVTVPDDREDTPTNAAYVIRDNDGSYVVRFDAGRRAVVLCDNIERAKRFSHIAANRFRRRHAGASYGLSADAAIVPIDVK